MKCSESHLRFTCNAVEDKHMHWGGGEVGWEC